MIIVSIATDFSDAPGGRYSIEGLYSGELFRENILIPKYLKAKENGVKLLVDLDGTYGYATSFLDEAFGKLSEKYGKDNVLDILEFKSNDQPGLIVKIKEYIKKHNKR